MSEQERVIAIITEALSMYDSVNKLSQFDALLGEIPEFDSMAVVNILTLLENHYGFIIDDDEIDAEIFATVATVIDFVEQKLSQSA